MVFPHLKGYNSTIILHFKGCYVLVTEQAKVRIESDDTVRIRSNDALRMESDVARVFFGSGSLKNKMV